MTASPVRQLDVVAGPVEQEGRLPIEVGEPVTLVFTSKIDDELHVHGYDLTADLRTGQTTELTFEATIPGVFEVELHDAALVQLGPITTGGWGSSSASDPAGFAPADEPDGRGLQTGPVRADGEGAASGATGGPHPRPSGRSAPVIAVTCRNGEHFTIDPDEIERVEAVPDTVVHLRGGRTFVLAMSFDELLRGVRDARAERLFSQKQLAGGTAEIADAASTVRAADLRVERRAHRRDGDHPGSPDDRRPVQGSPDA